MGVSVSEVRPGDFRNSEFTAGFFAALESLRSVGELSSERAAEIMERLSMRGDHVFAASDVESGEVVGATTLIVEPKFIRNGGIVGHIEDVSVRRDRQGRGIGRELINKALLVARGLGCYKAVLDCSEQNVPFYEGLGFRRLEVFMRIDF